MNAPLRAYLLPTAAGLELANAATAADPASDLAGSHAWVEAASHVLGPSRLLHVALQPAGAALPVGYLALERTRADWRSGSPGRSTLAWPFAELGYGFRPLWLGTPQPDDWLPALQRLFGDQRIELRRCATDALPDAATTFEYSEGIGCWRGGTHGGLQPWLASLHGKHRRDLAKYRRDITAAGGQWVDTNTASRELLDELFRLHHLRLDGKSVRSAYYAPEAEAFLRVLAQATAGCGLRLSLLQLAGTYVAGCLSFVHRQRFQAFVSGWDMAHRRLDLGRQVLYHQLLQELPRGLVEINFLGGDLAYKREFGLAKQATRDAVAHGGGFARLRAHVVDRALQVYRRARRPEPQGQP